MTKKIQDPEQVLATAAVFQGRVISLQVDTVKLANGKTAEREIVVHPGAVAILAVREDGRIPVLHQYRSACRETLIEIPAGKLEPGEEPLQAAKRELAEETGYSAKEWEKIFSFYTSPGFADEIIHLFAAKSLAEGLQNLDEDEQFDLEFIDRTQAEEWLRTGRVRDAKTICALQWWLSQPSR